jgi:hypothetical protein
MLRSTLKSLRFTAVALAAGALFQAQAMAQEVPSSLKLSGFATLGLVHNDNAEAGAVFSGAQKRPVFGGTSADLDTVVGLQADFALLPTTSLAVQVISRAGEEWQPKLRMAMLRQQLSDTLALRVGRMRSPVFMDSDTAEFNYASPLVRAPMPIYVGLANAAPFHDGADLQWHASLGGVTLLTSAYVGQGEHDYYRYEKAGRTQANIELSGIRGLSVSATAGASTIRLAHTLTQNIQSKSDQLVQLNQGITGLAQQLTKVANGLAAAGQASASQQLSQQAAAMAEYADSSLGSPTHTSIGFTTDIDDWHIVGEWAKLLTNNKTGVLTDRSGYALTVAYNMGRFTPFVSVSQVKSDSDPKPTAAFAATGRPGLEALDAGLTRIRAAMDQRIATAVGGMDSAGIGLRMDLMQKMALKVQYDRLKAPDATSPGVMIVPQTPYNNEINLFSVSLDVVF